MRNPTRTLHDAHRASGDMTPTAAVEYERADTRQAGGSAREVAAGPPAPPPRSRNLGDRVFFGTVTGAALVVPAVLALFLLMLAYGAWPSVRAFGLSFLT